MSITNSRSSRVELWLQWILLILIIVFAVISESNASGTPTDRPILQLETSTHNLYINTIKRHPSDGYFASNADDKTVRIWNSDNGKLVQTLRAPQGAELEGAIYDGSFSPFRDHYLAGGWTGYEWDGAVSVYIFNWKEGKIVSRITGLPDVVVNISFSVASNLLAITTKGLGTYFFDPNSYKYLGKISDCDLATNSSVAFDAKGKFLSICKNGFLSIYSPDFVREKRLKITGLSSIAQIRTNETGDKLIIWSNSISGFYVFDLQIEEIVVKVKTEAIIGADGSPGELTAAYWGSGGRIIFSLSTRLDYGAVYYYELENKNIVRVLTSDYPISDLIGIGVNSAAISYGLGSFEVKIINTEDWSGNSKANFSLVESSNICSQLKLNQDLSISMISRNGKLKVDPFDLAVDTSIENFEPDILEPQVKFEGSNILSESEILLCTKEISDGKYLVSTNWRLLVVLNGEIINERPSNRNYFSMAYDGDSNIAVAMQGDGGVVWFDAESLNEILKFYFDSGSTEWVFWEPSGYYASSPYGDKLIGWHLNNGKKGTPDYYLSRQFENVLYRPDIVKGALERKGIETQDKLSAGEISIRAIAPPKLKILSIDKNGDRFRLHFIAERQATDILEFSVFVNDIPVVAYNDRILEKSESLKLTRIVSGRLSPGVNNIRLEVTSSKSYAFSEVSVWRPNDSSLESSPNSPKGDLYLVAIGVDELDNSPKTSLRFAGRDADAFSQAILGSSRSLYSNIYLTLVSDVNGISPTKKNIKDAISIFKETNSNDTSILFIAAHGGSDLRGDYYMLPKDGKSEDVKNLLNGNLNGDLDSLVHWSDINLELGKASGKRFLIVDTCNGRNIEGNLNIGNLRKRSASSSFAIVTSSQGNQRSVERSRYGHGLFTYGILQALEDPDTDTSGNRVIELEEIFSFVRQYLIENVDNQVPHLSSPKSLLSLPIKGLAAI